ncbi:MAG TPA: hypothetical protein VJR89_20080, partial [Polyangiales bacterium]|nr:hypothetical protein [Polyangiales bacterium]
MQRLDEALQVRERACVFDHVVRGVQAFFAAYLRGEYLCGLLAAAAVARLQALHLRFLGAIDDQHAVIRVRATCFDEQRNDVDLVAAAGGARAASQLCADGRMRDCFQLAALFGIAEHALAHVRTVEPAVAVENLGPELRDQLAEHRSAWRYDVARN